jgi:hypothetical protein
MAIKVSNFNIAINGARITIGTNHDLYVNVVQDMEGKFFMDSDKSFNDSREYSHLKYVFFISIDWKEHTMSIGLCRKGESTHTTHSWIVPINKDVMKTPGTFLNYLTRCVEHNDNAAIMTTYLKG